MPYVGRFSVAELVSDFDISYEAASNAYNAAENRILSSKSELTDYENEFIANL